MYKIFYIREFKKMKNKITILILALFILFTVAGVSASEVDDNVMVDDENIEIESISMENDLKTADDSQVLGQANDEM